jgi:acyl-ACP thioesterase
MSINDLEKKRRRKMGDEKKSIWKEKYTIKYFDADVHGRAKLPALFNYLLNSTWNHAKGTSFSYDNMLKRGQLWALSRFLINIYRYPKWDDEIITETWGKGADRIFALRDYTLHNGSEEKFAAATSSWLIVDRTTYRPQKLDFLLEHFPFEFGLHELDIKLEKLPPLSNPHVVSSNSIRFRDFDVNKHVGAAKYVQWLMDGVPADVLDNHDIASFEINYMSEANIGDEIATGIDYLDGPPITVLAHVIRKNDSKELCKARITLSD